MIKLRKLSILSFLFLNAAAVASQNVGVGTNGLTEKLEINGKVKTHDPILNNYR